MKKSKQGTLGRANLNDEQLEDYYKEAALDSLLYWTNTTISHVGANATLTLLTEMLATGIEHLVPEDQVTRAETVIIDILKQSFDVIRANNAKDSVQKSDKKDMN